MTIIEKEIINLLDMIPFFPLKEKRDFVINKLPTLSDEQKKKVFDELGVTFRELIAQIPVTSFAESDLSERTKLEILGIEKKYLHELQNIESELLQEFLEAEKKYRKNELQEAEKMLQREFGDIVYN